MCEPVTIGVINYNGEHVLRECLSAIRDLNYSEYTVLLMDNKSTDQSVKLVKENFPDVNIVEMNSNAGPNPARNAAIVQADTNYVLLVDNDVILTKDCLKKMMDIVRGTPDVALVSPWIASYHNPAEFKYEGRCVHYIGAMTNNNYRIIRKIGIETSRAIEVAPATALLLDKKKALHIGLFDEDYFFGWEDGDFTTRMFISGCKCLKALQAIVYHETKKRELKYTFFQVRNRWYFILKTYSLKTILLISPAFAFYELVLFVLLTLKGKLLTYLRANISVVKHFRHILKKRKYVQSLRKIPDREILHSGDIIISEEIMNKRCLKYGNMLFNCTLNCYWRLIQNLI